MNCKYCKVPFTLVEVEENGVMQTRRRCLDPAHPTFCCPQCRSWDVVGITCGYIDQDEKKNGWCCRCDWEGNYKDAIVEKKLELGMYAGEARELGIHVSDHVPDCAKLYPLDQTSVKTHELPGGRIVIDITVRASWRWIEGKFEVTI